MSNGVVIYRGPSMLDGAPIVVVATGLKAASANEKTGGGLVQTWILRDDMSPVDAVNSGADSSICGNCPHRGDMADGRNVNRSCYVLVFQAPLNVWRTAQKGNYPTADLADLPALFAGKGVRLGSYGDPAAVPMEVWDSVLSRAAFHTGYTHQWRKVPDLARYCMASADSSAERAAARLLGFRVFRVRTEADPIEEKEVVCPASAEGGYKTSCDKCRACGGLFAKAKADIVIKAHGASNKVAAFAARAA